MTAPDSPLPDQREDADASNGREGVLAPGDAGGIPPEAYVIPRVLAQATLDYLANQPYREVFGLVRGFESLQPLPGPDSDPDSDAQG